MVLALWETLLLEAAILTEYEVQIIKRDLISSTSFRQTVKVVGLSSSRMDAATKASRIPDAAWHDLLSLYGGVWDTILHELH